MSKKKEIRVKLTGKRYSRPIKVPSYADVDQVAADLERNLQIRTPIDTGKARAGYYRTKSSNSNRVVRNDVKYIRALEDGHSKQAPDGFVNQAINRTIKKMRLSSPYRSS